MCRLDHSVRDGFGGGRHVVQLLGSGMQVGEFVEEARSQPRCRAFGGAWAKGWRAGGSLVR